MIEFHDKPARSISEVVPHVHCDPVGAAMRLTIIRQMQIEKMAKLLDTPRPWSRDQIQSFVFGMHRLGCMYGNSTVAYQLGIVVSGPASSQKMLKFSRTVTFDEIEVLTNPTEVLLSILDWSTVQQTNVRSMGPYRVNRAGFTLQSIVSKVPHFMDTGEMLTELVDYFYWYQNSVIDLLALITENSNWMRTLEAKDIRRWMAFEWWNLYSGGNESVEKLSENFRTIEKLTADSLDYIAKHPDPDNRDRIPDSQELYTWMKNFTEFVGVEPLLLQFRVDEDTFGHWSYYWAMRALELNVLNNSLNLEQIRRGAVAAFLYYLPIMSKIPDETVKSNIDLTQALDPTDMIPFPKDAEKAHEVISSMLTIITQLEMTWEEIISLSSELIARNAKDFYDVMDMVEEANQ